MYPQSTWPTTYYGPHSGVGIALKSLGGQQRRVAVVGLGAGTLAAWGRPGTLSVLRDQSGRWFPWRRPGFPIWRTPRRRSDIVLGDARVELERDGTRSHAGHFDVLAVDAFSSDAIPLHLLTAECGDVYARHLAPGGLLLLHISNRLLKLDPVARGVARHLGWKAVLFSSASDSETGESNSSWVLVTANSGFVERPEIASRVSKWSSGEPAPIT